jgi:hypothetical protein
MVLFSWQQQQQQQQQSRRPKALLPVVVVVVVTMTCCGCNGLWWPVLAAFKKSRVVSQTRVESPPQRESSRKRVQESSGKRAKEK